MDNNSKLIQALNDSEEKFNALIEVTFECVFITLNGYCIYANEKGCNLFGYSKKEIIGLNSVDIVSPKYKELVKTKIKEDSLVPYEVEAIRKDKSTFFAEIKAKKFTQNEKEYKIVVINDISRYKNTQINLQESESKYKKLIEKAGDGILIGNGKAEILEANPSLLKMIGYSKDEIIKKHISFIFEPECLKEFPIRIDILNAGLPVLTERRLKAKSGEIIPIEMNSNKLGYNYYVSIIRDIRDRKKAQEELEISNNELIKAAIKAKESDMLKTSFLANMSHEIRTPMNGIIGFAELLQNQTLNPEQKKEYINVILSSGQQLLNIINDILEISRIETGQVKIESAPFDVKELLNEIAYFFKPIADQSENKVTLNLSKSELSILYGDQSKIQQILTNLISNSLKFTDHGNVEVGIISKSESTLFYVKDTGIGISPRYINLVFDRFTQAQHDGIKKQKGTGLGLSICKRLTEMMNGRIWVESKVNVGSTFYFELPLISY